MSPGRCSVSQQCDGEGSRLEEVPETIEEAIEWGTTLLAYVGVDAPRLDAEIMMGHALGMGRTSLLTWPRARLGKCECAAYLDYVRRRRRREPTAYIVGHKEFYGLGFQVDSRVLVPRPETELLVEHAMHQIDAWSRIGKEPVVVDVGTGSGVVSISLAVHRDALSLYSVDCVADAIELAGVNASRHGVASRIRFLLGDLLDPLPESPDLIVANLPYVGRDEWDGLQPEIAQYEPRVALDGGSGGLEVVHRLLAQAARKLRPGGMVLLEIGADQGERAAGLARSYFPQASIDILKDYSRLDRVLQLDTI